MPLKMTYKTIERSVIFLNLKYKLITITTFIFLNTTINQITINRLINWVLFSNFGSQWSIAGR